MKDKTGFLKSVGFVRLWKKMPDTTFSDCPLWLSRCNYNTVQFVGVIFQIIVAIGCKNETIGYRKQTGNIIHLLTDKLGIKNYWKYQIKRERCLGGRKGCIIIDTCCRSGYIYHYDLYFNPNLSSTCSSIFHNTYFIWQPITLMIGIFLFFFPYLKKCLVHLHIHNIHNTKYVYRPTIHRNKVRHNMKMIINK